MKIKLLIASIFFLYFFNHAFSQHKWEQMNSEKWIEDLEYLTEKLEKRHAKLYHSISPEEFSSAVNDLKQKIPQLSNEKIMIEFVRLVAMIGDGHTDVSFNHNRLPISLYLFNDKIHLIAAPSEYESFLGYELIQIGNTPIQKAYELVKPLIDRDNEYELARSIPAYLTISEVLYALGITNEKDQISLILQNNEGEKSTIKLTPVKSLSEVKFIRARELQGSTPPLSLQNSNEYYWYSYLKESKTLYFKYNSCNNQKGKPSIKKFSKTLFEFVDNNEVEKFVIDLRHNPGGNFHKSDPIIEGIIDRPQINQEGKLFVVTSHNTGSAATVTAASLKMQTNAILVGGVSRANPNFTYNSERFELPNSDLVVGYTKSLHKPFPELGDIVNVDIPVEQTYKDYYENKDPILEKILAYGKSE